MPADRHRRGTEYLERLLMPYWLMKSEPAECSIDDALAAPDCIVPWVGVRNFQARNFMRDQMKIGDGVLFYHSSCAVPGIAGIAEVASAPYPDPTQFDPSSPYYDEASRSDKPRWILVDVRARYKVDVFTLAQMRDTPELQEMRVLRRGNRLSITPVEAEHWKLLLGRVKKAGSKAASKPKANAGG
jgi:predicted RNA-binding protein with PUA-like domain